MSLTSRRYGTGRVYVRRFDHEEAARRYAAGERIADLAVEYGVTANAVYHAISPEIKRRNVEYQRRWRSGTCEECGGPAMRLVSGKKAHNRDGRSLCHRCRSDAVRERLRFDEDGVLVAVRCTSADCANGERWQPPEFFARGIRHREVRQGGIHNLCRACQRRAKQRYRATHPEYRRTNGSSGRRARKPEAVSATRGEEA